MRLPAFLRKQAQTEERKAAASGLEIGWAPGITAGILHGEHNAALQGKAGVTAAEKMLRVDAQVRSVKQVISLPIRSTAWTLEEPEDATPAEKEATELLRGNLFGGMEESWDDLLQQATAAVYFGTAIPEIVWEEREGRIAIRKIAARQVSLVEQWLYDPDGRLAGYIYSGNRPVGTGLSDTPGATVLKWDRVAIPREKTLHLVYEGDPSMPTGFGIWRSIYPHWYIKDALYRILSVGIERNLLDVPVGRVGPDAQDDDKSAMLTMLSRWRAGHDAAVVLPDGQDLEFIGSQRSLMDAMPFLHHHNTMIAQAGLAQFMNLGQQSVGTQSLATEHVRIFEMSLEGVAGWIEDAIQRQVVVRWMRLNYGDGLRPPQLRHRPVRSRDQAAWAQVLAALVGSGHLHPTVDDEEWVRGQLELPAIPREQLEALEADRKSAAAAAAAARLVPAVAEDEEAKAARERVRAIAPGDAHGHQANERQDEIERKRRDRRAKEARMALEGAAILERAQRAFVARLLPLIREQADGSLPVEKLRKIAMEHQVEYREHLVRWMKEAVEAGRRAFQDETGQEPKVQSGSDAWIKARAETLARGHYERLRESMVNIGLSASRRGLSPDEIADAMRGEPGAMLGRLIRSDLHGSAAELITGIGMKRTDG